MTTVPNNTTQIARHLTTHGFDVHGNIVKKRKLDDLERIDDQLRRHNEAQSRVFNRSDWQACFIAWAVGDDISLRKTTSERLHKLLCYRNPFIKNAVPKSHNTTRQWILDAFKNSRLAVRRCLSKSKSRITISFDGWRSGNQLDLLGIVAHFIDEQYAIKNVLLGLRNTYGSHIGAELKHHLLAVLRDYRISTKVAFFMADNASNNDKALELLQTELNIDPVKQRLRCAGHIINLVCKAVLYGTDVDCINDIIRHAESTDTEDFYDSKVSQFEATLRSSNDELEHLKAWRKKGPVGKLHNIVIHARATPARREFFMSKQREASSEDSKRLYQLVVNGGIRWNSTCDMLERAIKLMDAIELYQQAYKHDPQSPLEDDLLSNDDWHELKQLLHLLLPLKEASLAIQSNGKDCHHGNLYENLVSIDYLMTKLEESKMEHQYQPNSHFKACINLGWKKLNKYYTLSDDTPAYRAAIILHPSYKMRWLKEKWQKEHPRWIGAARDAVEEMYNQYKRLYSDELATVAQARPTKELSDFERYNTIDDDLYTADELEQYLNEPRVSKDVNPIEWWRHNQGRYPVLHHLALDLLAAPASSSADERQFSMAGHVLDEDHWQTLDDLAEAYQCVKSAYMEGIDIKLGKRTLYIGDDMVKFTYKEY